MAMNSAQARVIDPILTTVAQGYRHPQHVGYALFPRVPVMVAGGQVLEFGKESFRLYNSLRGPGANTRRIQFAYLGKPYALFNHSLEVPVPRELQRDAQAVAQVDLGARSIKVVMESMSLRLEYDQAQIALSASNYDTDHKVALSGTSKWSDPAGNPNTNIEAGREAIRRSVGVYPNVVLLSGDAFAAARNNPNIIERFKYTSKESITTDMLAALWNVDKVVVGAAIAFDDADAVVDVWGNNVVLAYVPSEALSMEQPSYGYTYTMNGHPLVEQSYFDPNAKSQIYGVSHERAPVLTGMKCGYLIQNPK